MPRTRISVILSVASLLGGAAAAAAQEPPVAAAQKPPASSTELPAHAIYIETGGLTAYEAGYYSLNFEQRLIPRTYLRLGIFYGPVNTEMTMKLPLLLNYVLPGAAHNLEVGAGVRWDVLGTSSNDVRLGASIGYRYHELPGHALLRAGLNFDMHSLKGGSDGWSFRPWPSLAIGLGF